MALSLCRGTPWSQVCVGRPNSASKLYLPTLSTTVYHRNISNTPPDSYGSLKNSRRPLIYFLCTNKKVNLTEAFVVRSYGTSRSSVDNTNNISIGGKNAGLRPIGIIRRKDQCGTGLFSGLHRSLLKLNSAFINPARPFRSWEPSIKALYVKKPTGEMSNCNLKVDPSTPDSKKSASSGSDSPDSIGSSTSAKSSDKSSSPGIQREDMAPNEREQLPPWKINKEKYLKTSIDERRARCKSGKLLENIETWPEYYLKKERDIKDDRKAAKACLKSCPQLNNKVSIWKGDITSLVIDAIVNAANESLMGGGGVDGAIHSASGKFLKQECMTLKPCPTGYAVITGGYGLPSKYVIHTVGPRGEDSDKLRNCYENSLNCLLEPELKSIAFPCVSTGIYGYPNDKAADVALTTVRKWLEKNYEKVDRVIFCLFLEKDIRIYEDKMQQYFPISNSDTGKASQDEPKVKPQNEM